MELNLVCSGATTPSLAQASLPIVTPLLVMQLLFAKVRECGGEVVDKEQGEPA